MLFSFQSFRKTGSVVSKAGAGGMIAVGLMVGGCVTRPLAPPPPAIVPPPAAVVEPEPEPAPVVTPTPTPTPTPPAPPPRRLQPPVPPTAEPAVPVGESSVLVESDPSGAMVVVNGVPVGRTPKRLNLPVSPQGFSRETVSIKVRFIGEGQGEQSQTVEEVLTPLDRLPSAMHFAPGRVQRKMERGP